MCYIIDGGSFHAHTNIKVNKAEQVGVWSLSKYLRSGLQNKCKIIDYGV